jgi:hypothetical protein
MPVATTVPTSSLEFGNRIDAELYRPALRESFEKIFQTGFAVKRLILLCYKRSAPQKGQLGSRSRMWRAMAMRSVAMEAGLCRA